MIRNYSAHFIKIMCHKRHFYNNQKQQETFYSFLKSKPEVVEI